MQKTQSLLINICQSTTATGADTVNPALRMAEKVVKDAKDGVLLTTSSKFYQAHAQSKICSSCWCKIDAPGQKISELVGYVTRDIDA